VTTAWHQVELAELCSQITSGGTPSRQRDDYYALGPEGHAWVKSSELRDGSVRATQERVSDLGLKRSAAKLLPAGSVLIAMYGATAGRVGLLKMDAAVNQAVCALVIDPARADPVFLFHALRSKYRELAGKAAGAAQQNLSARIIKAFRIAMPDAPSQRRIAAVLAGFDELIEINERRIALLEELARSLYREWFVRLRFPGHKDCEFVESDRGLLPQGWEARTLLSVGKFVNGFAFTPGHWGAEGLPIIKIKELKQGIAPDTPRYDGDDLPAKFTVEPGDLLFSWSADLGVYLWPGERGLLNQPLFKVTHGDGMTRDYLFHALEAALPQLQARAQGTTMKHIKRSALHEVSVILPHPRVLGEFSAAVAPVHAARLALARASNVLATSQELLLTRLVTGRLNISDIELGDLLTADPA
jgi:type I restriction enzyme S subunit